MAGVDRGAPRDNQWNQSHCNAILHGSKGKKTCLIPNILLIWTLSKILELLLSHVSVIYEIKFNPLKNVK